jgi:hypothetical protein
LANGHLSEMRIQVSRDVVEVAGQNHKEDCGEIGADASGKEQIAELANEPYRK